MQKQTKVAQLPPKQSLTFPHSVPFQAVNNLPLTEYLLHPMSDKLDFMEIQTHYRGTRVEN